MVISPGIATPLPQRRGAKGFCPAAARGRLRTGEAGGDREVSRGRGEVGDAMFRPAPCPGNSFFPAGANAEACSRVGEETEGSFPAQPIPFSWQVPPEMFPAGALRLFQRQQQGSGGAESSCRDSPSSFPPLGGLQQHQAPVGGAHLSLLFLPVASSSSPSPPWGRGAAEPRLLHVTLVQRGKQIWLSREMVLKQQQGLLI